MATATNNIYFSFTNATAAYAAITYKIVLAKSCKGGVVAIGDNSHFYFL